ncbi:MAG: restriction endonuclease subunit S [Kofleriaceae bacterium]
MSTEWRECSLGDVLELKRGYDLPDRERRPGTVPIVSSGGISGTHDEPKVVAPGVVTGRYGTLGLVFYLEQDYWPLNTTLYVRDFKGNDPHFISYFLRSLDFSAYSDKAAVPGLNRNHLHEARVRLPPLSVQRQITQVLSVLDSKIELNRQMNETLEAMARALFKSWFVDFDPVRAKMAGRAPFGMNAATAALFPATLAGVGWTQQPDVPSGWSVLPIRDVVEGVYDGPHATPPDATSGPIFLGIRNFRPTGLDFTEVKHIAESDWPAWTRRVTPTAGDIVFTYEATLGYFGVVPVGVRCCLGRRTALVRPRALRLDGNYLFHWFIGSPFQAHLQAHKNPGSTVDRILLRDFPDYPVLAPPRAIVETFAQMVAPMGAKLETNQAESRTLAELRDLLLPKLLSGELRIRDAEKAVEAVI